MGSPPLLFSSPSVEDSASFVGLVALGESNLFRIRLKPNSVALDVIRRSRSLDETLRLVLRASESCGVEEVRDLSSLEDLGVHVVACRRANSQTDAVTFGKGLSLLEAEVGARMEAFEFKCAEPGDLAPTAFHVEDSEFRERARAALEDFIPLANIEREPGSGVVVVDAEDIETGCRTVVPAELALRPAPPGVPRIFGSSTNGLASGNTLEEASFCSLLELIERDIWSMELARQRSGWVDPASLPSEALAIRERVRARGLGISIRSVANDYQLPFFACFIYEAECPSPSSFNGGWGCSFDPERALMQSIMEAVQGRIGMRTGARRARKPSGKDDEETRTALLAQIQKLEDASFTLRFGDVPRTPSAGVQSSLDALLSVLRRSHRGPVHRIVLTGRREQLQVTRVVAPGLEHYRVGRARVGQRLREAIRKSAESRRCV
ncbi:MAG: YcaO-like family protein [Actinomycetota bacterium]|nr:YcaO-like family protein [Actinomycetota bacterium]